MLPLDVSLTRGEMSIAEDGAENPVDSAFIIVVVSRCDCSVGSAVTETEVGLRLSFFVSLSWMIRLITCRTWIVLCKLIVVVVYCEFPNNPTNHTCKVVSLLKSKKEDERSKYDVFVSLNLTRR